jgi:hypothetical protein
MHNKFAQIFQPCGLYNKVPRPRTRDRTYVCGGEVERLARVGVEKPGIDGGLDDILGREEVVLVLEVHLADRQAVGNDGHVIVRDTLRSPDGACVVRPREHVEYPDLEGKSKKGAEDVVSYDTWREKEKRGRGCDEL